MPSPVILLRDYHSWQAPVLDKDLATPPGSPVAGDRYLIGASPTGTWATHAGHVGTWDGTTWSFATPSNGWFIYVLDENLRYRYNGTAWVSDGGVGEANTASNVGTAGIGIFKQKTGVNLEFKGIKAGSTKVTATDSTGDNTVALDVVPAQIDHNGLLNYAANQHCPITYDAVSHIMTVTVP
jgi:hypothetical protein